MTPDHTVKFSSFPQRKHKGIQKENLAIIKSHYRVFLFSETLSIDNIVNCLKLKAKVLRSRLHGKF